MDQMAQGDLLEKMDPRVPRVKMDLEVRGGERVHPVQWGQLGLMEFLEVVERLVKLAKRCDSIPCKWVCHYLAMI